MRRIKVDELLLILPPNQLNDGCGCVCFTEGSKKREREKEREREKLGMKNQKGNGKIGKIEKKEIGKEYKPGCRSLEIDFGYL